MRIYELLMPVTCYATLHMCVHQLFIPHYYSRIDTFMFQPVWYSYKDGLPGETCIKLTLCLSGLTYTVLTILDYSTYMAFYNCFRLLASFFNTQTLAFFSKPTF